MAKKRRGKHRVRTKEKHARTVSKCPRFQLWDAGIVNANAHFKLPHGHHPGVDNWIIDNLMQCSPSPGSSKREWSFRITGFRGSSQVSEKRISCTEDHDCIIPLYPSYFTAPGYAGGFRGHTTEAGVGYVQGLSQNAPQYGYVQGLSQNAPRGRPARRAGAAPTGVRRRGRDTPQRGLYAGLEKDPMAMMAVNNPTALRPIPRFSHHPQGHPQPHVKTPFFGHHRKGSPEEQHMAYHNVLEGWSEVLWSEELPGGFVRTTYTTPHGMTEVVTPRVRKA